MKSHSQPEMNSVETTADKLCVVRALERHKRPTVVKLGLNCWLDATWTSRFKDEALSMATQDLNPGFAIRKIGQLFETRRYEECASLIQRLSFVTMKIIAAELPMELMIETIPQSLTIIEVIYGKFYDANPEEFPSYVLLPDRAVSRLVMWVTSFEDPLPLKQVNTLEYYLPVCKNILKIIAYVHPKVRQKLKLRQNALRQSVKGLGSHGLVDTSEAKLMNLHDALKIEFQKMSQQLKVAILKLEELSLAHRTPICSSVTKGPAPTSASHQRLLQVNQLEVQERLIKNKTLLNVVEPAMTNNFLASLLHTLEKRIETDKEVLFNFTELRKDVGEFRLPQNAMIAPMFQKYSQSYCRIMDIIQEVNKDVIINGYHSDEDEGISNTSFSSHNTGQSSLCFLGTDYCIMGIICFVKNDFQYLGVFVL